MPRLSDKLRKLEDRAETAWIRVKPKLPRYAAITVSVLYLYGMFIRFLATFLKGDAREPFTWDPVQNIRAVFTPYGLGITLGIVILYCLFTKKGLGLLSVRKPVLDKERGLEILPEGTHGTSGWMDKKEMAKYLQISLRVTVTTTSYSNPKSLVAFRNGFL